MNISLLFNVTTVESVICKAPTSPPQKKSRRKRKKTSLTTIHFYSIFSFSNLSLRRPFKRTRAWMLDMFLFLFDLLYWEYWLVCTCRNTLTPPWYVWTHRSRMILTLVACLLSRTLSRTDRSIWIGKTYFTKLSHNSPKCFL